jgi:15-cis-phytoene synthase
VSASSVQDGYASAERVTRHYAKSFYFSSLILFGRRRRGSFALYAFCRRLDEVVDGAETDADKLRIELEHARHLVDVVFGTGDIPDSLSWPRCELLALRDTVSYFGVDRKPLLHLIDGMQMDLEQNRYASDDELMLYCHRAAGVVGLMMAPLLGATDPSALRYADDLGQAMQLTNILRDLKEDWHRNRVYVPQSALRNFGILELSLGDAFPNEAMKKLIALYTERARTLYRSGLGGVVFLRGFGSQRVVRLMASIYGGILDVIEARQGDVFSSRARLSGWQKLKKLFWVLLTPNTKNPFEAIKMRPLDSSTVAALEVKS